jgi:hypothetical protein
MKPKTVISLLAVVLILAAASYFLLNDQTSNKKQGQMGAELMQDLPLNDIAAIAIFGPKGSVKLVRGPAVWQVENKYNYPADFSKIIELTKNIKHIKVGRSFQATDDSLTRQKLFDPKDEKAPIDQKGVRITLADDKNKPLADLIIGNTRQTSSGGSGQYLRKANEKTIYLAKDNFPLLEQKPEAWLEKKIINLDAKEIKAVNCFADDSDQLRYHLERPERTKAPKLISAPQKGTVDSNKIEQVFEALSPLNIDDINGPPRKADDPLPKTPARLEYQLYNGKIITIYPASQSVDNPKKALYQMTLTMDYRQPESSMTSNPSKNNPKQKEGSHKTDAKDAKTKGSENSKKTKSSEEIKKEVMASNAKLKIWTFKLAKWQYDSFITSKEGLMETNKENKTAPQ